VNRPTDRRAAPTAHVEVAFYGGKGNDRISAGCRSQEFSNLLRGGAGDHRMSDGCGESTQFGGSGDDVLRGGSGTFVGQSSNDTLQGGGDKELNGGSGFDSADYRDSGAVRVEVDLALSVATVFYEFPGGGMVSLIDQLTSIEDVIGSRGPDSIVGDDSPNSLRGFVGNDVIVGAGDSDHVLGGSENDDVSGGAGDDIVMGGSGDDNLHGTMARIISAATSETISLTEGLERMTTLGVLASIHVSTLQRERAVRTHNLAPV
jgi:Ca2+-binding RTX toxin-like protein